VSLKRRDFVARALPAAVATAALGCASEDGAPAVRTSESVRWRLASSFPRALDTLYGAAEVLATRVAAMSEGRFTIRPYPAGEIVPGLQVMDAVQQRTVEVGQTASYYFAGKNPALNFDTSVPFGLTARQQTAWLTAGGGLELLREVFADFDIVNFTAGSTGVQMGGWFKREIGSLADLRGLKMRIPALGGRVMDRLGATVQVIAGGEVYTALERGTIDAAEWIGPYDDEKLGFDRVAAYYYYPGWWEPGPTLTFCVNRGAWEALPAAYREIFQSACAEVAVTMQARYDALNPPALQRLVARGVQLRRFPDDVMAEAERQTMDILEADASADATFARILASWKKSRGEQFAWWGTAELAYARYAFGGAT
jgi:TRAP-type mannitol/chloroaromatic compound transport system substrate-binding protein